MANINSKMPSDYIAAKLRWDKKRNSERYHRIWKKFISSKTRPNSPFGICTLPPEVLYKRYGIHVPMDPKKNYPSPKSITPSTPNSFDIVRHCAFVIEPNFRPVFGEDGEVYDYVVTEEGGNFISIKDLGVGNFLDDLKRLVIEIDLEREPEAIIFDALNLIKHYLAVRKKLGLRIKKIRKKVNVSMPRHFKQIAAIAALKQIGLSIRDIASIPKSSSKIHGLIKTWNEMDYDQKQEAQSYFSKLQYGPHIPLYSTDSPYDSDI